MKKNTPLVSVIMTVFNAQKYVGVAIQSILNQTYPNFELIIIDDCSSDNSWKIVNEYSKVDKRIKASRNKKNLRGCATMNKGMHLANGKYIAIMDNDDWSYPDRIEKQVGFLENHSKVGIVGGSMEIVDESSKVTAKRSYFMDDTTIRKYMYRYSPFSHPLIMIRKSVLDVVGLGNCDFAPADDYELYFRIGIESKFANLSDVILRYRIVSNSITHNQTKRMILSTIKVRNIYKKLSTYKMTIFDELLNSLLHLAAYILPSKFILLIFRLTRDIKAS